MSSGNGMGVEPLRNVEVNGQPVDPDNIPTYLDQHGRDGRYYRERIGIYNADGLEKRKMSETKADDLVFDENMEFLGFFDEFDYDGMRNMLVRKKDRPYERWLVADCVEAANEVSYRGEVLGPLLAFVRVQGIKHGYFMREPDYHIYTRKLYAEDQKQVSEVSSRGFTADLNRHCSHLSTFGKNPVDVPRVQELSRQLLEALGEDPNRPGLKDTPRRFAKWWGEFLNQDPGKIDTVFAAEGADQMVVLSGLRVWSLCEHHMLPFYADLTIAYIPDKTILGLSKIARIAKFHARNLQVQERLVEQIADHITHLARTPNVAVRASGLHLCMVMRGVEEPGIMTTQVLRGAFFQNPSCRTEFLNIAAHPQTPHAKCL